MEVKKLIITTLVVVSLLLSSDPPAQAQQQIDLYQTTAGQQELAAIRQSQILRGMVGQTCHQSSDLPMCFECASALEQLRDLHGEMANAFASAPLETQWPELEQRWYRQMYDAHYMEWYRYSIRYEKQIEWCNNNRPPADLTGVFQRTSAGLREAESQRKLVELGYKFNNSNCSEEWEFNRSQCQYCSSLVREIGYVHQRMAGVFDNARVETEHPDEETSWHREMAAQHRELWDQAERRYGSMSRRCRDLQ